MKTITEPASQVIKPFRFCRRAFALVLAVPALIAASAALAEPPTSAFTYPTFDASELSIWKLEGTYPIVETVVIGDTSIPISFNIELSQDARGKLSGDGPVTVFFEGDTLEGTYAARGRIRTVNGLPTVNLTIRVRGSAFIEGRVRNVALRLIYQLQIDSASAWVSGEGRGTVTIAGLPRGTINSEVSQALPPGTDGSWRLTLDIESTGPKLKGTATARLSNGDLWTFRLNGTYNEANGTARLRLVGPGGVLTLNTVDSAPDITSIAGRFLGQSVGREFTPPWPSTTGIGTGGGSVGRLSGFRTSCTGWSFSISGEDFSSTSSQVNFQYDFQSRVIREFGSITATRTGLTYSYEARYAYDFFDCFSSVTLTVSGGLLSPSLQTITF